jgi:hypothetical protein
MPARPMRKLMNYLTTSASRHKAKASVYRPGQGLLGISIYLLSHSLRVSAALSLSRNCVRYPLLQRCISMHGGQMAAQLVFVRLSFV